MLSTWLRYTLPYSLNLILFYLLSFYIISHHTYVKLDHYWGSICASFYIRKMADGMMG